MLMIIIFTIAKSNLWAQQQRKIFSLGHGVARTLAGVTYATRS